MNSKILTQVNELIKNYNTNFSGATIVLIEKLLEEYLTGNPQDTQIWFKLALVAYRVHDDLKATECLEHVLKYEPSNGYALIMMAYIADKYPYIDDKLFEILSKFHSNDNTVMSMITYMKSKYYFSEKNKEMEEESLAESVELCDKHVFNCIELARLYIRKGEFDSACRLLLTALSNTELVEGIPFYKSFELQEFLNRNITGIWLFNEEYKQAIAMLRNIIENKDE